MKVLKQLLGAIILIIFVSTTYTTINILSKINLASLSPLNIINVIATFIGTGYLWWRLTGHLLLDLAKKSFYKLLKKRL